MLLPYWSRRENAMVPLMFRSLTVNDCLFFLNTAEGTLKLTQSVD